MRNFLVILLTLGFFFSNTVQAQELTKTQKRALKKEIRTYKKNPEKWVKTPKFTKISRKKCEKVVQKWSKIDVFDGLRAELLSNSFLGPRETLKNTEKITIFRFFRVLVSKSASLPGGCQQKYKMYFFPGQGRRLWALKSVIFVTFLPKWVISGI